LLKSHVFLDITPYNPLKVNRHFGGKFRLHLRTLKIGKASKRHESKRQLTFNGRQSVTSHKKRVELIVTYYLSINSQLTDQLTN
jgi:hypothetical protein